MPKRTVLISGGGPAGTVLAYWLGKHDFEITILERSNTESQSGQVIDIEGPSQEIVHRMGLMEKIKAHVTHEAGVSFHDDQGLRLGTFPVNGSAGLSNEIEIMRPALNNILIEGATSSSNVTIRYGCTIKNLKQSPDNITVNINDRQNETTTTESFDLLIVCDGLRSQTRDLVLPESQRTSCIKSLNAYIAFFSITAEPQDRPNARACNFPGRRLVFLKPLTEKTTSAYLGLLKQDQALREARESRDVQRQKAVYADKFKGLSWETDRLVKGMMESENFYFEELSQVKLDKWTYGRCALLGDSAWCPSPLTGQGTNLAILGAYVLASKLVKHCDTKREGRLDHEAAFAEFEKDLRPYVNKVQPIPLGGYVPLLVNPETWWGIWILRTILSWLCWLQVWRIIPDMKNVGYELPDL